MTMTMTTKGMWKLMLMEIWSFYEMSMKKMVGTIKMLVTMMMEVMTTTMLKRMVTEMVTVTLALTLVLSDCVHTWVHETSSVHIERMAFGMGVQVCSCLDRQKSANRGN